MNNEELQRFLPFGYIYLVVLGILKESIHYYYLDINILKYSSIMDILISPIADITSYPVLLLILGSVLIILILLKKYILKNINTKFSKDLLKIKDNENLSKKEIEVRINRFLIGFYSAMLISFFLGFGFSGGYSLAKKIKDGTINFEKHSKTINFNSDESKTVYVIDHNSSYYFYVEKGKNNIEICPIGSIKSIELN